jgi:hypothetical protein
MDIILFLEAIVHFHSDARYKPLYAFFEVRHAS